MEERPCLKRRNLSYLSLLSSNPLISCVVTLYILMLLYFPPVFFKIISWPVPLSTAILLLTLLRIGANQRSEKHSISTGKLSISKEESVLSTEELLVFTTGRHKFSSEESICALNQSRSSENQSLSSDVQTNSSPNQRISWEKQNISTQVHGISEEESCISLPKQSISSEKQGISTEEQSISSERQGTFSDELSVSCEEQIISTEEQRISSQDDNWVWSKTEKQPDPTPGFNPLFVDSFLEWDVKAPLEVIYEESDEEREDNERVVNFHPSLSLYYPESDTESSSSDGDFSVIGNWDSPESISFRWEEEEDDKGLIEIALDGKRRLLQEFQRSGEEENMIEIDIFPARQRLGGLSPVSLSNSD